MPLETGSKYDRALRKVISYVQILIYKRDGCPIRNRKEVLEDVELRLIELRKNIDDGEGKWPKTLLELAAYCVFAKVADE